MKRFLLIIAIALLAGSAAWAQSRTWALSETGWGRVDFALQQGVIPMHTMGEINIPRWRKATGTLKVDFEKKEAVLSQSRGKDKTFHLMTESRPHETRDGWSYVEYEALDNRNAGCRFWVCKHESGAERLLVFYPYWTPDTVYGYRLTPEP